MGEEGIPGKKTSILAARGIGQSSLVAHVVEFDTLCHLHACRFQEGTDH